MPLDPNILLQNQQVTPLQSPLDSLTKAMTLKHLAMQNQASDRELADQQSMRDAYKSNMTVGSDGTPTLNRAGFMSQLAPINPMLAMQKGQEFKSQDLASQEQKLKTLNDQTQMAKALIAQVPTDAQTPLAEKQMAWSQMKQQGIQLGLPNADKVPDQYPGDQFANNMRMHLMTAEEQLSQQWKQKQFDQKTQELGLKHEENSIKRQQLDADKVDKFTKAMKDDLDADKGRAGNFGIISGKVQSAQRLQTLVGAFKDGNLPSAQTEEMALGLANMIGNTNGAARAQVEALVPKSAVGDATKVASWVMNKPFGAEQQAFIEQMTHTIDREKQTATDQLNSIRASRLTAHNRLRTMAPDRYNAVLQGYGMDPSKVGPNGQYQTNSKKAAPLGFDEWKASQGGN